MQRDCMKIQISRSQIPHTPERQIQTTVNTGNMLCLQPNTPHSGTSRFSLSQVYSSKGSALSLVSHHSLQLTFVLCPGIPLHLCSDGVEKQHSCQSGEWLTFWRLLRFKQLARRRQQIDNGGSNWIGMTEKSFQINSHDIPLHA